LDHEFGIVKESISDVASDLIEIIIEIAIGIEIDYVIDTDFDLDDILTEPSWSLYVYGKDTRIHRSEDVG